MPDYIYLNSRGQELATEHYSQVAQARAHAERLAMDHQTGVTFALVIAYNLRPTCALCPEACPRPATRLAGDWELCDEHYEAITAPWPEEVI